MQYIYMKQQITNTWKNYDKNIESPYPMYLDANILYGWAMSQKLPENGSKLRKILSNQMKTL